ncbi:MAG: hypothetical protein ACE5HI_07415 [bacterium]
MPDAELHEEIDLHKEAIHALFYFFVYLGYLFINPENEFITDSNVIQKESI